MKSTLTTWLLTVVTMFAFAANSVLCRMALQRTHIDPATFTFLRIASGALMLWLLASASSGRKRGGDWLSAAALLGYAAAFSFAYVSLAVGTGALLLFGAVQATMILWGLIRGERLTVPQLVAFAVAMAGLVILVLPGISAPPAIGALLMAGAGACWGVYSLRGRRGGDPLAATAGNFQRAVALAAIVWLVYLRGARFPMMAVIYALLSGALASGVGYALWYAALRGLTATRAAVVQLSVPVLAAAAGVAFLGERVTIRLTFSALAVLGGIALFVSERKAAAARAR